MATASSAQINAASVDVLNNYGEHYIGNASAVRDVPPATEVTLDVDHLEMLTSVLTKLEITLTNSSATDETVDVAPFGLATYFAKVLVNRSGIFSNYNVPGYAIGTINQKRSFALTDGNTPANALYNTSLGLTAPGSKVTVPASGSIVLKDLFFLEFTQNSATLNGIMSFDGRQQGQTTVSFWSCAAFFGTNPLHHPFIGAMPTGITASASVSINPCGIVVPEADVYDAVSKTVGFEIPPVPPIAAATRYSLQPFPLTSGLVANSNKRVSLPANVAILSAFLWYNNGNQFNPGTDIAKMEYKIGPAVTLKTLTPDALNLLFIRKHGSALRNGVYCFESEHPQTQKYGQHRLEITPSLVNPDAYLEGVCEVSEVFKGQPLL